MTTPPTTAVAEEDDPLSQAMSMLDSLTGDGSNDFEDFAIDSDEDGDNEDVDLNDLNLDDDDVVDLDAGLDSAGGGEKSGGDGGGSSGGGANSEGAAAAVAATTLAEAPPSHWATKQDVTNLSAGDNAGGSVNSTTASSLTNRSSTTTTAATASKMNQQHPHPSIVHPLQDLPGMSPITSTSAPTSSPPPTTTNPAAALTATTSTATGSWTSSFASFASRAAASVQTAVESAEAAVLQTSGSAGGIPAHAGAPGGIRIAHNSHLQQQQQGMGGVSQQQGSGSGVQPAGSKQGMSYQERQRLLHQQYHANNASKQSQVPSMNKPQVHPQHQATMARRSPPNSGGMPVQSSAVAPSSPQKAASDVSAPSVPTPIPAAPTFLDKLTTSLDTPTKTKLISSALGPLLPGERVIMFLNSLKDVRDSTFGQVFVGSGNVLRSRGMGILCEGISVDDENVVNGSFGEEGGSGGGTSNGGVTTVWCCVMTFYRVAVFSYRATLDGKVLLDSESSNGNSSSSQGGSNMNETQKEEMIQQWLHSQNVSIQFQAAHCPPPSSTNSSSNQSASKQTHHVFQMPLASIERVEKTLASSQKAMASNYPTGVTSNGVGYASGYSAILPSSSTVSSTMTSTASSAMVSLGSQMKPLLGGMASSTSNSNLLTNGDANLAGTGNSAGGTIGTTPTGPLGIVLHGKDGGRWIRFSTSNYTDAQRAHEALNTYAFPGRRNLGYLFAFESRRAEVMASSNAQQQQQQGGGGQPQNVEGGNPIATAAAPTRRRFLPLEEFERQGIFQPRGIGVGGAAVGGGNSMGAASPWAPILNANANYGLCSTYPSVLVGPRSIVGGTNDPIDGPNGSSHHSQSPNTNENIGLLRRCAAFRSENRFPALTWGSKEDGGSIWRSSQPKVGLQGNRSPEDERYLYAIGEEAKRANLAADARSEGGVGGGSYKKAPSVEFLRMLCGRNNESDLILSSEIGGGGSSAGGCMLKIMDMRPKSAAMGNRTQGYGYENTNNYRGTTINFYGIGNIHAVRDAYQKVNTLCLNPNTSDLQWMQLVENTNWPSIIRLILSASWQTAFHVHYNRLPVLVHCSHGWDRTSQVPALAQLLLDPYYRTREGFSTLVEKDFLSFGHPFHTRCGHGEGKNEQGGDEGQLSPIFLQFLDCVFQLVNQFPDYFEFNSRYLLLLSEHVYSCRFGTLLCDSEREREVVAGTRQRTYCMWDYLDSIPELVNPIFDKAASERAGVLLMPLPMLLRNVTLWTDRYCMYGAKAVMPCVPPGLGHAYPPTYVVQCPAEQALVLHTIRNGVEGTLRRALEDAEMWRETALAALNEVKELKKKKEQHANDASKD